MGAPPSGPAAPAFATPPETRPAPRPPVDEDDLDFKPRGGKGKWIVLFLVALLGAGAGAVYVLRPDLVKKLMGGRVNELAVQQATAAKAELKKDSYAGIERARGMFEKAASLDPKYAAAKAGLAEAELARAEYLADEAAELQAKLAQAPTDAKASMQAEVDKHRQEAQQRVDRAFVQAKEALELEPDGVDGLRTMADYYRITKAPDSMKPLLEQAHEKAPGDAGVAYVYGASVASDPTLAERAIRYFDEALEASPDLHRARYAMARVFWTQGNKAKAQLHAETVLKAVPDHERSRALLNEINPPPVVAASPPAPAEPPKEKELTTEQLFARADRLRELDKPQQALKLYEKAAEQSADDPDAYTGIGWCYFDMESYDAAIASFNRALQLVPRFSDAHFGIAETYRAQGMKRDAVKHYRAYLDIVPEGEEAELARRMLQQLQQ
jgi:tetratricopeptide (TPR) repeat protein